MNPKVLFLHGLESGVNGSKARYLQKIFGEKNVFTPDLQISIWKLNKKNSILRKLLASPSNFFMISRAGMDSLQSCVDIVKESIQTFKPDIIVGSSMGGALITAVNAGLQNKNFGDTQQFLSKIRNNANLSEKEKDQQISEFKQKIQVWEGPVLMLAPALEYFLLKTNNSDKNSIFKENLEILNRNNKNIYIYHGDQDDTVPIENSESIVQKSQNINFTKIEGGDHRLNTSLIDTSKLEEIIQQIMIQKAKQDILNQNQKL